MGKKGSQGKHTVEGISVFVRVRPLSAYEEAEGSTQVNTTTEEASRDEDVVPCTYHTLYTLHCIVLLPYRIYFVLMLITASEILCGICSACTFVYGGHEHASYTDTLQ